MQLGTLAAILDNPSTDISTGPVPFSIDPERTVVVAGRPVYCFADGSRHRHEPTIRSFSEEWKKFDRFTEQDIRIAGDEYFDIVPRSLLHRGALVLDMGCGSGRWTRYLSGKVGSIDAVDPSEAIFTAAAAHQDLANVRWSQAGLDPIPFNDGTFDLVICLGVLHHVPETGEALARLARKVKRGGHLLIYLYYDLENRGRIYRSIFQLTELLRKVIINLPLPLRSMVSSAIAFLVYLPMRTIVRLARAMDRRKRWWHLLPLSYYHNKSMRIMRNDSLDRFGTPLEERSSRKKIEEMMGRAGLTDLRFSTEPPYWHVLATRN